MQVFIATSSWQEVRPGQRVPGGLHVRLNLETGKKEARLLAPEAGEGEAATTSDHEALKEALKNIKSDYNPDQGDSSDDTDPSRFRTMDELKEALGEVQLNMETDLEVLTQLVDQFRQTAEESDKVSWDWSTADHVTMCKVCPNLCEVFTVLKV